MASSSPCLLDCDICFHHYDSKVHVPVMFGCQHHVCKPCLGQLLDTNAWSNNFPCPKCREPVERKSGGADAYQKSRLLLELIENEKQETKCQQHPSKPISLICLTCKTGLCSQCMVGLVKDNLHSAHDVQEVEDAYAKRDCILERGEKVLQGSISPSRKDIEEGKEKLKAKAALAKQIVRNQADGIVKQIRNQQQKTELLIDDICQSVMKLDETALEYFEQIETLREGIHRLRQRDPTDVESCYGIVELERMLDALPVKKLEEYHNKLNQSLVGTSTNERYEQITSIQLK